MCCTPSQRGTNLALIRVLWPVQVLYSETRIRMRCSNLCLLGAKDRKFRENGKKIIFKLLRTSSNYLLKVQEDQHVKN